MICVLCYFISINAFLHAQGVTNTFDLISFIRLQIESRKCCQSLNEKSNSSLAEENFEIISAQRFFLLAPNNPPSLSVSPAINGTLLNFPRVMSFSGSSGRNGEVRSLSTHGPNATGHKHKA
jgi:hypothetical protein